MKTWQIVLLAVVILAIIVGFYVKSQKDKAEREAMYLAMQNQGAGGEDGKGKTNILTILGIVAGTAAITSGAWWLFGKDKNKEKK